MLSISPMDGIDLNEDEWIEKSIIIRKYHELTHFVMRKTYPDDIDYIRDELIADCIGLICAFIVSFIFNYTASMKWVFDSNSKNKFIPFLLLSLKGLGINELLLYIGIGLLHYNKLIVKLISTIIVMIFNFTTRKILIEKKTN